MEQPDKYFIITPTIDEYDTAIRTQGLPPGQCFHCIDEDEARRGIRENMKWGIDPIVIHIADRSISKDALADALEAARKGPS